MKRIKSLWAVLPLLLLSLFACHKNDDNSIGNHPAPAAVEHTSGGNGNTDVVKFTKM